MRRAYVDAGWGQVHYRESGTGPTLVCLQATAYSGRSVAPLMSHMGGRRVVAVDTPGYGGSDGPPRPVVFEAYATAVADAVALIAPGERVDVFGYHTGALIAAEIAAQRPTLLRRMVLMGVPFFKGEEREEWRRRLVHPTALSCGLEQFQDRWDYLVTARAGGVSLQRGFENFVDELFVYPREWWAHAALFEYEAATRLAQICCPVLVINPVTPLAAASRAAAAAIPGAVVREMPEVTAAPFDTAADVVAGAIEAFLQ
jgi:pimeloyl-ACP methyl ester carboxylesterase